MGDIRVVTRKGSRLSMACIGAAGRSGLPAMLVAGGFSLLSLPAWARISTGEGPTFTAGLRELIGGLLLILILMGAVLLYRNQLRKLSERSRALVTSEERFRLIVEGTSVVAWEYDIPTDRFTYVSAPAERLLGYALETWKEPGFWRKHIHPDDLDLAMVFLRGQIAYGGESACEYRLLHADGREVHVRDLRALTIGERGEISGMRGIFIDISEHKASEAMLEDSEARFRGTFEQAAMGVALCSVSGRYMRVNQRYCEITGYSEAELLLRDFREITHPDDIEPNEHLLDVIVLEDAKAFSIEKRMIGHHNRVVWVNATLSLVRSSRGNGQFMECIEDISARKQAERELRESEGRMRTILAAMREGVIMYDANGRVILTNTAARRLFGLGSEEAFPDAGEPQQSRCLREDGSPCPPNEMPNVRAMNAGRAASAVIGLDWRDGSRVWLQGRAEPLMRDPLTGRSPVVLTVNDITAQRRAEEELRLAATVFDSSVEAIMITDSRRRILSVNKAFSDLTGFPPAAVLGQTPAILVSSKQGLAHYDGIWREASETGSWQGEVWQRRRDGSEFPEWLSIGAVKDRANAITHYVAVFSDITERKANEARIAFLAHHDPLTALPNRTLFQDRLEQALARAERSGSLLALLFLDLDRFKTINDSLGHLAGDRLLQAVAERLLHCVRDTDTICRQGGDEFIVVLADIGDAEVPARIAEKILRRLAEPFEVDGHVLGTSFSIGIAVYPHDGRSSDVLMKNADTAMYHAKEAGRNTYRFFTEQMNANALERLQMENQLRLSLERQELLLHYQPLVRIDTGEVVGVEALIRWQSDELGFVPPSQFIPVAEECGMIVPIGRWVLRQACEHAKAWQEQGQRELAVSVNISALQFRRDNIVQAVMEVLRDTGLPARSLELELTESLLMVHADEATETLQRLKSFGVRLSIDDFGTGYSSLSYLRRFAVDRLKIDQSFIRDMADDPDDAAIVRAVVQMGKTLKLEVLAEGVESRAQAEYLLREGCREAQGYFFCPPVTQEGLLAVLAGGINSLRQDAQEETTPG